MASRDGEWKSKTRPQSTMALAFSADLDSIFGIGDGIDGLERTVKEKKQMVSSQTAELQALEARLQATEARLKERMSRSSSPVVGNNARYNFSRRTVLSHANDGARPTSRSEERGEARPGSRPGTNHSSKGENGGFLEGRNVLPRQDSFYKMRSMPGALPQTPPVSSRNAYS